MNIKKLLLVCILVSALVSTYSLPGSTEDIIKNIKVDGGMDVRMISVNNLTDRTNTVAATGVNDDLIERTISRIVAGASGDLNESISGRLEIVKNARQYGQAAQSIGAVLAALAVQNAYLDIKASAGLNIRLGRQPLGDEGDMVLFFGKTNNTALAYTACDAINASFSLWKLDCNVIYSKLNENAGFFTDTDLSGFSVSSDELLPNVETEVFFYNRTIQNAVAAINDGLGVVGLKTTVVPMDNLELMIEAALNLGTGYSGNGLTFNATYDMDIAAGKVNAGFDWASGSGDNPTTATVNEGFVPIASDKRYGDVIGKNLAGITNMGIIGVFADITPSGFADSKLKIGLAGYTFSIKQMATGVAVATNKALGTEIDVRVTYSLNDKSFVDFENVL